MKLVWSQAGNGCWNGKAGPYTLMVVAFHETGPDAGWWVHPKLPGLKSQEVQDEVTGKVAGERLFREWLKTTGIEPGAAGYHPGSLSDPRD